jgi:membrane protein
VDRAHDAVPAVIIAFTFIYVFVPNTKVRFFPALGGGIVGGVLWQSQACCFALFVTTSAQYSSDLFEFCDPDPVHDRGSIFELAHSADRRGRSLYRQQPSISRWRTRGEPGVSMRMRERLALTLMSMIARQHVYGGAPWTWNASRSSSA